MVQGLLQQQNNPGVNSQRKHKGTLTRAWVSEKSLEKKDGTLEPSRVKLIVLALSATSDPMQCGETL